MAGNKLLFDPTGRNGTPRLEDVRGAVLSYDWDDYFMPTGKFSIPVYNKIHRTHLDERHYYNMDKYLKKWGIKDRQEGVERLQAILHLPEYMEVGPNPEAVDMATTLRRNGNKLYVNTSRPQHLTQELTEAQVDRHVPDVFTGIIHSLNKGETCREIEADAHFDDHADHIASVNEQGIVSATSYHLYWNWDDKINHHILPPVENQPVHSCTIADLMKGHLVRYQPPAPGTFSAAR